MKRMMMIYSALAALIWMTAIGYATAPAPVTMLYSKRRQELPVLRLLEGIFQ